MRAMVYKDMRDVRLQDVEDSRLKKHYDIRVTSTTICGSDLHLVHGMVPNLLSGSILGHETMEIVEEPLIEVLKIKKNCIKSC